MKKKKITFLALEPEQGIGLGLHQSVASSRPDMLTEAINQLGSFTSQVLFFLHTFDLSHLHTKH